MGSIGSREFGGGHNEGTDRFGPTQSAFHGTVILLATYNGRAFLGEQLRSLTEQTDPNWMLVVRDDCSTDGTPEVVDAFATSCRPGQVVRLRSGSQRLGPTGNFIALLREAPPGSQYAFCDQDDVWLPDKLARASRMLAYRNREIPALYCARQIIVDRELRELGLSPDVPRPPSLRNALVQNIATGCTIVMNEAARRAVLAVSPPSESFHDWWCYLVTSATGGQVSFDAFPVVHYRQHGANVVGIAPDLWTRGLNMVARGPKIFMRLLLAQTEALLRHPNLTVEARTLLQDLSRLPMMSLADKMRCVRRTGLYRQGRLEQAALNAWIVSWHLGGGGRGAWAI